MGRSTQTAHAESLGKPSGSNNVWTVPFAISENCDFPEERRTDEGGRDATIAALAPAVQLPIRACAVCAGPLTTPQKSCCSVECSIGRARSLRPGGRDQRGAKNANWKGGRAKHPVVYVRRFKANNPEKVKAHQIIAAAIRSGQLTRPAACASCLRDCRPDAHHPDYTRPLSVEWLCRKCHAAADKLRPRYKALKPRAPKAKQPDRHANVMSQQVEAGPGRRRFFQAAARHARTVTAGLSVVKPTRCEPTRSER